MTNQEIFTKVRKHLLRQKARSSENGYGFNCMYRNPDGLKCAVGCLIPKRLYKPCIEGLGVLTANEEGESSGRDEDSEVLHSILKKVGIKAQNFRLLGALQAVHDCSNVENWEARLREVAKTFRLKWE